MKIIILINKFINTFNEILLNILNCFNIES